MTNIHSFAMRGITMVAFISVASLISACTPSHGHYDAKGNFVSNNTHHNHPGRDNTINSASRGGNSGFAYQYRGYYDDQGNYISSDVPGVPAEMFPQHGMCRIWMTGTMMHEQPPIVPCNNIRFPAPQGAYVVSGGRS
jgi:hypothetical protein